MSEAKNTWKVCSICKTPIPFQSKYYVCNVSTCNGKRTGLVFCSIPCFERHLPGARHKDAYALEEKAPQRRILTQANASTPSTTNVQTSTASFKKSAPKEILVVVSKLKNYINLTADMNTSAGCSEVLSDIIRCECDKAIEKARQAGRKTVLDRDFK